MRGSLHVTTETGVASQVLSEHIHALALLVAVVQILQGGSRGVFILHHILNLADRGVCRVGQKELFYRNFFFCFG